MVVGAQGVVARHDSGGDNDQSWRTGPIDISEAAAAKSAKHAELTRYTAFGRRPENIIKNPGNRRLLNELQHGTKPRRMTQSRLRELSTTKLGLQLQEQMAALAASDSRSSLGGDGGQSRSGSRRRPRSAAAASMSAQKPRRRRTRLKDVPAESLAALRLLLSSCGVPTQYASALACFGFSSVGELTRATHQNLLDVGLRPGHARALRRLLENSFDSDGLPLAPAELPAEQVPKRPASAPPARTTGGLSVATEAVEVPQFAQNYSNPTPQLVTTPGASPHAAASDLESLLSTLELTTEKQEPEPPLAPEQVVTAEIASAAADVAADLLANQGSAAGFAQPGSSRAQRLQRPQSARPTGRPSSAAAAAPAPSPAPAPAPELGATGPPGLSLDDMEERLQSEVLKLDELERIEAELQAEIARLRAQGTQAGIVTGDSTKLGGGARRTKKTRGGGRGTSRLKGGARKVRGGRAGMG